MSSCPMQKRWAIFIGRPSVERRRISVRRRMLCRVSVLSLVVLVLAVPLRLSVHEHIRMCSKNRQIINGEDYMRYRKSMSRKRSGKLFRRTSRPKKRNQGTIMRGGRRI